MLEKIYVQSDFFNRIVKFLDNRRPVCYKVVMKRNTKEDITKVAFEIVHKKGFNNTGIKEILASAGVPKGSFYFYFQNKDDLGIQLIDYFLDSFISMADDMLHSGNSPLSQLRLLFEGISNSCEITGFQGGCLVGNMAQESGGLNKIFHTKLDSSFRVLQGKIGEFLKKAVAANELPETINITETAGFILSSLEGALLQMKVMHNTEPYRTFEKIIFDKVLK